MPKKIDPALGERAVRLVREHRSEYPSLTAASAAVARQIRVGRESVRRWVLQADIDDGARDGVTTAERFNSRMHHIGIGRAHKHQRVNVLIHNLDIRIINPATGELLRELTLDPTHDYQPQKPQTPSRRRAKSER